ncbi:PTS beta-glucoside transporter subunit EIIBCA [Lactococcus lactis]|jgi:PTS system beta-glucosides-specific IIC component|uniref:PTS system sucrose-specific EIIBCA component n=1 Tax=Lactococcus lactis subsp. lactis NCDO 2118 TaxID=1117941 RepID=A0ABC8A499_LACLL|nr:beta-glucoside-specific PTS transporter subunit IIABC [Lactococcus lactis]ABX75746.1 PTS system, beta-glucoside-specific IIABC component [Lactococcus lactis subsp. lactis KF147]AII12170.1 PTS system, beta-glucoside-specific IIABC component [Lactococcus lactis subsp. lactis NCDO 2118]OSP87631.1 PTS beta-glucoside transporter subunit EIIBCA [Lactococcus lactis]
MNYTDISREILEQVGGEQNVKSLIHCMTRLRFVLKDESIVNDSKVEKINGVIGTNRQSGQYQIIIGNNVVPVYNAINSIAKFNDNSTQDKENLKGKKQNPVSIIIEFISACMSPLFPALIGAGLLKVLLLVLGPSVFNIISSTNDTYIVLNALGDATFYFLPILVAVTASQRLKTNPYLAVSVVSMLIYPDLITLLGRNSPTHLFGFIPIVHASYASSLVPALLAVLLLKYIEIGVDKLTPEWAKNFLKPFLILLITGIITLVALAPLGSIIGVGVMGILDAIYNFAPWLAMGVFAAAMPFIVMTGMHWAFVPLTLLALGSGGVGYDLMLLPAMLASNLGQAGATFGVAFKTKDKDMRGMAFPAAISALLAGVTEPALYGVTLKLKKPLYAACISSGIAGIVAGLFTLKAFAFATPSLLSILQFISPKGTQNFVIACAVGAISFIGSLVLSYIVTDGDESDQNLNNLIEDHFTVYNPIKGSSIDLSEVDDATFSSGVLGEGYAINPEIGIVKAPFTGTVEVFLDSNHALGLVSNDGINVLIHVGLDTVNLGGKYFYPKVKQGDKVVMGQTILEFDLDSLVKEGYQVTTPIVITNSNEYSQIIIETLGKKDYLEQMIAVK